MTAFPVFLFAVISTAVAGSILLLATIIGPKHRTAVKLMPYESGMNPVHDARQRFSIAFYLIAIEFLIFDLELLILYPWAVAAGGANTGSLGRGVFWVVMIFFAVLVIGFAYTWRKGVFKWK